MVKKRLLWLGKTGDANSWYHIYPFGLLKSEEDPLVVVRHSAPANFVPNTEYYGFKSSGSAMDMLKIMLVGAKAIMKHRPDVIITFNPIPWGSVAWLLSKVFRKKLIMGLIGGETEPTRTSAAQLRWIKFMCNTSSRVSVTGTVFKQKLIASGIDSERIFVFPHCVSDDWFDMKLNENPTYDLITVAALLPGKRIEHAVEALKILHDQGYKLNFCVLGDGPERKPLEELTKSLGLEEYVHFKGQVSNVAEYLTKAKIFVQSSENEGLSIALVEAMALGLVSVATEAGAEADHIEDGKNGYLVQPHNVEQLASKIKLLQDKEKFLTIKSNLDAYRPNFKMERAANVCKQVIDSI